MTLEQRVERIEKLLGLGEDMDPAAFAESMRRIREMLRGPSLAYCMKSVEEWQRELYDAPSDGGDGAKGD